MMARVRKGNYGLTIIRLMIPMAIIGILATIVTPPPENHTIRADIIENLSPWPRGPRPLGRNAMRTTVGCHW